MAAARQAGGHQLARLISLAGFILLWWAAARLAASPQLLPAPEIVARFAWEQVLSGAMPLNLAITMLRVAAAFLLSMGIGVAAGYIAGRSPRADAVMDPWLVIALNLPVLVVIILVYIWVGLNDLAAVLAVAIVKTPTVMVTVREGARALDPGLDDLAQVFRIGRLRRLRRIVLPQLSPYLAAAARSGLSITWKIGTDRRAAGSAERCGFRAQPFLPGFQRRWDPGLRVRVRRRHAADRDRAAAALGAESE